MKRRTLIGAGLAAGTTALLPRAAHASQPLSVAADSPVHVLFVAAHPDDETLNTSVALPEHLAAGYDVHVLWLTNGGASTVRNILNGSGVTAWWGVRHDPAAEGYAPLSVTQFEAARVRESLNAVHVLRTGEPGSLTAHYAHLPDGGVTQADAQDAIRAVANTIPGPWRLKGHTDVADTHPDHLAAGRAMRALSKSDPGRFGDARYYVNPANWTNPKLPAHAWDLPNDAGIKARAINAVRCFGAWSPPTAYAIGMQSVTSMFAQLLATPKNLYHS